MVSAGVLGALAGFAGALVALGIPLLGFLYRVDRRAGKAVRLLTGDDEVEGDGVIPRLRTVEEQTDRHEQVLEEEQLLTDGGR